MANLRFAIKGKAYIRATSGKKAHSAMLRSTATHDSQKQVSILEPHTLSQKEIHVAGMKAFAEALEDYGEVFEALAKY